MNEKHKTRRAKLKTLFVALCAVCFISNSHFASATDFNTIDDYSIEQEKKVVTGLILDSSKEPIIGASILENGTSNGTITDINGRFTLSVKPGQLWK